MSKNTPADLTYTNPLRHYLPEGGAEDKRAGDELKAAFFAALLPRDADVTTRTAYVRSGLSIRVDVSRGAGDEEKHTVYLLVDGDGTVQRMVTRIAGAVWQHTLPTAQRTLCWLVRRDPDVLCGLGDVDTLARLRGEISRLDDVVYARQDEAYRHDARGVVANPDAPAALRGTMRRLAEAMLDRDGNLPCWWREPLPTADSPQPLKAAA